MGRLDDDEIAAALGRLQWDRSGSELVKTVKLDGFTGAMVFVNEVARLAEQRDHHPDIDIRWDTVSLRLTTHSAGGLTERDVDLASAIDAVANPPVAQ